MPIIPGILELVQTTLYDQQPVPVGNKFHAQQPIRFFREPWADEIRNGTSRWLCPYLRTNLVDQPIGRYGQRFLIQRINALFFKDEMVHPLWTTPLYSRTLIEFLINQKVYWRGPAWACASPLALFNTPKEEIERMEDSYGPWKNLLATFEMQRDKSDPYKDGILIERQEEFSVQATIENNTDPDVMLAIHLDGPYAKPVF